MKALRVTVMFNRYFDTLIQALIDNTNVTYFETLSKIRLEQIIWVLESKKSQNINFNFKILSGWEYDISFN